MSEERPVRLRFFVTETKDRFVELCKKEGIEVKAKDDADCSHTSWDVVTGPLKPTQRRNLIGKWASISMERNE